MAHPVGRGLLLTVQSLVFSKKAHITIITSVGYFVFNHYTLSLGMNALFRGIY